MDSDVGNSSREIREAVLARKRAMIRGATKEELDERELEPLGLDKIRCTECRSILSPHRKRRICRQCREKSWRAWIAMCRRLSGWKEPDMAELKRLTLARTIKALEGTNEQDPNTPAYVMIHCKLCGEILHERAPVAEVLHWMRYKQRKHKCSSQFSLEWADERETEGVEE